MLARVNCAYTYAGQVDHGPFGVSPEEIAGVSLGSLLRPATTRAIATADSRREVLALLFASPEFQRR
jgi:uncharacterized protein (DUF1800 family)